MKVQNAKSTHIVIPILHHTVRERNLPSLEDPSLVAQDDKERAQDDRMGFWRSHRRIFQNGLTLIEVLIAMGIAVIVGVLLPVIIVNSVGLFTQQSAKVQTGLNINDALSAIRGTIKQANAVEASSSANILVLKVASIDSGNNIIPNTFDSFVFSLDQNALHFKILPAPGSARQEKDQILGTSVTSLNFQYFNSATPGVEVTPASATKVRISLTLKQKIGTFFEGSSATSEANLRND